MKALRHEVVTITPAMAAEWLTHNTANRSLSPALVEALGLELVQNNWRLNGETIKFSKSGRLLDGQHRLTACVQSGHSFRSHVVRGLDEDSFETIDIGRKRTAGDILSIAGYKNTTTLAPAVRWVRTIENGLLAKARGAFLMTAHDERLWVEAHPGIHDAVARARSTGLARVVRATVSAPVIYLTRQRDRDLSDDYFDKLETGAGMEVGHPALAVRNRLLDRQGTNDPREAVVFLIRGWNALRHGDKLTNVKGFVTGRDGSQVAPDID